MRISITKSTLSPNTVKTGKPVKIAVFVKEGTNEPIMYRLPFRLGQEKGGIK